MRSPVGGVECDHLSVGWRAIVLVGEVEGDLFQIYFISAIVVFVVRSVFGVEGDLFQIYFISAIVVFVVRSFVGGVRSFVGGVRSFLSVRLRAIIVVGGLEAIGFLWMGWRCDRFLLGIS
jgi:hypothetical protein